MPLQLEEENPTEKEKSDEPVIIEINQDKIIHAGRNISDSLITTTLNNNDLIDSVVVVSNNAESRNYSDFEANLEEFKRQGIARNKRTEALARMNHVNPGYIRAPLTGLTQ